MAESSRGRALCLLTNEDGRISPDKSVLERMFRREELDGKKISIISIAGAFRKGKSFILNFFLHYLESRCRNKKKWVEKGTKLRGFDWTGGTQRCTVGIMIWDEIFYIDKGNEEIAIFLMDTQGLFDAKTGNQGNTTIFALSTLMSSLQIFNITHQIQENDLNFLQFFTAYAEACQVASSQNAGNLQTDTSKPFENLLFLIRDWQNPSEYPYGLRGGRAYLQGVLQRECSNPDLDSVRRHVEGSFTKTECCLLPYPGEKVAVYDTNNAFNGCVDDISGKFLTQAKSFVESIMAPANLPIKCIKGEPVSNIALIGYIGACCDSVYSGDLPNPSSFMETMAEARNMEIQRNCLDEYVKNMRQQLKEGKYVPPEKLEKKHLSEREKCLKGFDQKTAFGPQKTRDKHKAYLEKTIEREYNALEQMNNGVKIEREKFLAELIGKEKKSYVAKMEQVTESLLLSSEMKKEHARLRREITSSYQNQAGTDFFTNSYLTRLVKAIDDDFSYFEEINLEKLKAKEEKDVTKLKILQLHIKAKTSYRERMNLVTGSLISDKKLQQSHEENAEMAKEEILVKLADLPRLAEEVRNEEIANLAEDLNGLCTFFKEKNGMEKDVYEKKLAHERKHALDEYDDYFRKMLKHGYMKEQDLNEEHNKVKKAALKEIEGKFGDILYHKVFEEHTKTAEKVFEERRKTNEQHNESNRKIYHKIFAIR